MRRTLVALAGVVSIFAFTATQALAFDCVVANKPVGAGSVGTVDIVTEEFTPNKPNPGTQDQPHGGFVTLTGTIPGVGTLEVDTLVHSALNHNAPFADPGVVPGAAKQEEMGRGADGKGLDTIEALYFAH